MHEDNKKNIGVSVIIVVVFILLATGYAIYHPKSIVKKMVEQEMPVSNCGLTIHSPLKNQNISTTTGFDVEAVLDNRGREAIGCSWVAFEGQVGVVRVQDANGNDIADPTPLGTTEDWMTDAPVEYFTHVNILNNYTGQANVVIDEENPSDESISKTISFPVVIIQ
jgi:hypothetical protein